MAPAIAKRKRDENQESLLKDEVEFSRLDTPFPRGGGSELAPLEIRKAAAEATSDVFDQIIKSKKPKKGNSKSSSQSVHSKIRIEPLALNKIRIGTLVLGRITDIRYQSSELVVSLPNNLVGYCASKNLEHHQIGRYLRFAVIEVGEAPKKRLILTQDPEIVNQTIDQSELTYGLAVQGVIKSIEEKGFVLDLGSALGTGFLPISNELKLEYREGEAVLAFAKDSERRIKPLSIDPTISVTTTLSQPSLVPGTLVKSAPVNSETAMGVIYDLLGHITATSDAVHSQGDSSAVRVLFSHPSSQINGDRSLGVSRSSHIVSLKKDVGSVHIGKVIDGVTTKVMPSLGLLLEFNDTGNTRATGLAHISQIEGSEDVSLEGNQKYAVLTKHKARIIGYSALDGTAYLSLNEAVINQKYISLQDVRIGDKVSDATIDRILPRGGVLVCISKGVIGIASELQLSDTFMKNPELRYKVGQKVACRVLNVDLERERVELSLKKSLIEFQGPILEAFESLNGAETMGTVIRTIDSGAKLLFFGGVRGLLPTSELSETGVKAENLFWIGQSVKVHVIESDASRDRLILSTRPRGELANHIGEVVSATVSSRNKQEARVVLQNGIGEASLIGGYSVEGKKLKATDEIEVKVLNDRLVSNDPMILNTKLPSSFEQFSVGQVVTGFVSGSQQGVGLFIGFQNNLAGLIPANTLPQSSWPTVGKAIEVSIDTVDIERKRVFLSLPSAARTVSAIITGVKSMQLNVTTDDGSSGRIDISHVFASLTDIEDPKNPLSIFKHGQKLKKLYVIGRHVSRDYGALAPNRKESHTILDLSLIQPSSLSKSLRPGSRALAYINNYSDDGCSLWVNLTPTMKGQLSLVDLTSDPEVLRDPKEKYPVGTALEVTIIKASPHLALTALDAPSELALIFKVFPLRLMVRLPFHKTSAISCVDSADEFTPLKSSFNVGDIIQFDRIENSSHVTLRSKPHHPATEGEVRKGFVCNIASGGVFVNLAPNVIGRAKIGQLADTYLKDWKKYCKIGDVVDVKILSVSDSGKIELSLKPSVVTGKRQPNIDKVEVNRNYNGTVRRVEAFGVFVDFKGVSGLCHRSEISDHPIDNLARVFKAGDSVRVKVLAKDEAVGKLSLGMKAKYFESDEEDDDQEELSSSSVGDEESHMSTNDFEAFGSEDQDSSEDLASLDSDGESSENVGSESESLDVSGEDSYNDQESGKTLSAVFNWDGELPELTDGKSGSDGDSDSDDEPRRRRRRKREEFVRDETANLQTCLPQSAKDFERLLVSTPNSSILWMNYMAFQLQLGEIDGAREIARRGLKTIPQQEEEERMNVWVALLNLEAQFGTPESTEVTFREAQQFMDSLTIHLRMATVYAQAGKLKQAIEIYKRAHKRFGGESMDPWLAELRFYFTSANNKIAGRALADQALQRLPKRMHRDFTRQFALIEFELGDAERGRTLFEALVASAPKRIDIWNVYIDQEIKHGSSEEKVAALFDRVLEKNISMKQAKFFFKKWINVASDQEYVKMRAREYVESREKIDDNRDEDSSDEEGSESEEGN